MKVAGFDIGGANTDLAVVDFENNNVKKWILLIFQCGVIMKHYLKFWLN
jgi:uncharacterized hydantoinase/oxoprolinase family protein